MDNNLKNIDFDNNLNLNKNNHKYNNSLKEKINNELSLYIKQNLLNIEYSNLISKNPSFLFKSITSEHIILWESLLFIQNIPKTNFTQDEILSTPLDNIDQIIIRNDCSRTRVRESKIIKNFKEYLEILITKFIKMNNIKYKQGLNEIFGPILLLQFKLPNFTLSNVYLFAECFIKKFIFPYYKEKNFYLLKFTLNLFNILLLFHEPEIYNRFQKLNIVPEIFATNWIMTLFSSKLKINIVYELWDHLIRFNDNIFILYLGVALLKLKKELILNVNEIDLPILITNVTLLNINEVEILIQLSLKIREKTPYSFKIYNDIGINQLYYKKNKNYKKKNYHLEYFENFNNDLLYKNNLNLMPIFPSEFLFLKHFIKCPDFYCENFFIKNNNNEIKKNHIDKNSLKKLFYIKGKKMHLCEYCDDIKTYKILNEIIIINLCENNLINFNNKIILHFNIHNKNDKNIEEFTNEIINNYKNIKNKYNFIIVINEMKYIKNNYEYENFLYIIHKLIENNFPYISYIYGGNQEIINFKKEFNIIDNNLFYYNEIINIINNKNNESWICNYNGNKIIIIFVQKNNLIKILKFEDISKLNLIFEIKIILFVNLYLDKKFKNKVILKYKNEKNVNNEIILDFFSFKESELFVHFFNNKKI